MHGFTLEVGCERSFAIWAIEKGFVAIGTECTRKHTNVAEDTLWQRISFESSLRSE